MILCLWPYENVSHVFSSFRLLITPRLARMFIIILTQHSYADALHKSSRGRSPWKILSSI